MDPESRAVERPQAAPSGTKAQASVSASQPVYKTDPGHG